MKAATLDFTTLPGFSEFVGMDADLLTRTRPVACLTIAMMFTSPCGGEANTMIASIVMMALYAGGANALLTAQQFRQLERRVKRYITLVHGRLGPESSNLAMARYVLRHGVTRAKHEGIFEKERPEGE